MKTTTFGDENRLFTQMRGKTIGISLKDRGAILPAGHTANAAYWFDGKERRYMDYKYILYEGITCNGYKFSMIQMLLIRISKNGIPFMISQVTPKVEVI